MNLCSGDPSGRVVSNDGRDIVVRSSGTTPQCGDTSANRPGRDTQVVLECGSLCSPEQASQGTVNLAVQVRLGVY